MPGLLPTVVMVARRSPCPGSTAISYPPRPSAFAWPPLPDWQGVPWLGILHSQGTRLVSLALLMALVNSLDILVFNQELDLEYGLPGTQRAAAARKPDRLPVRAAGDDSGVDQRIPVAYRVKPGRARCERQPLPRRRSCLRWRRPAIGGCIGCRWLVSPAPSSWRASPRCRGALVAQLCEPGPGGLDPELAGGYGFRRRRWRRRADRGAGGGNLALMHASASTALRRALLEGQCVRAG